MPSHFSCTVALGSVCSSSSFLPGRPNRMKVSVDSSTPRDSSSDILVGERTSLGSDKLERQATCRAVAPRYRDTATRETRPLQPTVERIRGATIATHTDDSLKLHQRFACHKIFGSRHGSGGVLVGLYSVSKNEKKKEKKEKEKKEKNKKKGGKKGIESKIR